MRTAD